MSTAIITNMYPDGLAPYLGTFVYDTVDFFGRQEDIVYPGNKYRGEKMKFYYLLYNQAYRRIIKADRVVIHYPLFFFPLVFFAWTLRKDISLVYHGGEFMDRPAKLPFLDLIRRIIFRANNALSSEIFVPSGFVARTYFLRWDRKLKVWYSGGVRVSDGSPAAGVRWFTFGYFGRLGYVKGYDSFLRSLEALASRLPEGSDVRSLAVCRETTEVSRVSLRGIALFLRPPLSHEHMKTYLDRCEFVVVPSRTESLCLLALEAAACGCLVIARRLPAIEETLGDCAIYFQDDHDLADTLEFALSLNEEEKETRRRRLTGRVVRFDRDVLYEQFGAIQ